MKVLLPNCRLYFQVQMHKMLFGQLQMQTFSQSEKPTQIPALSEKFDYAEHSKLERFLKVNVRTQVSIIHSKQPYSAKLNHQCK